MSEQMPEGGVNELLKTHEGKRHLEELQKRHEIESLQPKNPDGSENAKFHKVYDSKIAAQKEMNYREEQSAKAEWSEVRDKRQFDQMRKEGRKRIF